MSIRQATSDDAERVRQVLGTAFQGDCVVARTNPDAQHIYSYFHDVFCHQYVKHGEAYVTEGGEGAALWLPPGVASHLPSIGFVLTWLWGMLFRRGLRYFIRALQIVRALDRHKPRERFYYLHALGVLPEHQGQGHGGRLILEVTRKCDAENMPAYLENSKQRNLPLYRRMGFEVIDEYTLEGEEKIWFMWRQPRPPAP